MRSDRSTSVWLKLKRLFQQRSQRMTRHHRSTLRVEELEERLTPDDKSASALGIDARDLRLLDGITVLTGQGISIAQVEGERPGLTGYDTIKNLLHPDVTPTDVFLETVRSLKNKDIADHPLNVAGIMIADGPTDKGVAPNAALYSAAFTGAKGVQLQRKVATAAQHAVLANNAVATNISHGFILPPGAKPDGRNLLTTFIDWSAQAHDTLYVVAGNEFGHRAPIPTDE